MGHFHATSMAQSIYGLLMDERFTTHYDEFGDRTGSGSPIENPKPLTIKAIRTYFKERLDCCLTALEIIKENHRRAFKYLTYLTKHKYGVSASEGFYIDESMLEMGIETIIGIWEEKGLVEKIEDGFCFVKNWYDIGNPDKLTQMEIEL